MGTSQRTEPKECRVVVEDYIVLPILTLSFYQGAKWKFTYMGNTICITVNDSRLFRMIESGLRFGKGDALRVKLRKNQIFDQDLQIFKDYSYKIDEFYEHIPAPTQGNLFD